MGSPKPQALEVVLNLLGANDHQLEALLLKLGAHPGDEADTKFK